MALEGGLELCGTLCSQFVPKAGVFNLLSSRANLHLSYDPAGRTNCRLQNHHGYIKHHHRAWAAHQVT